MNNSEEWRDVIGYEGSYQVSNLGSVRSLDRKILYCNKENNHKGVLLKDHPRSKKIPYRYVVLSKNNMQKKHSIHRLVATNFITNPHNKREVNHIDGNMINNNLENLEWSTSSENHYHAIRIGLVKSGAEHCNNKKVIQLDLNGNRIEEFPSVTIASKKLGIPLQSISRVAKKQRNKTHGFKFEYINHK